MATAVKKDERLMHCMNFMGHNVKFVKQQKVFHVQQATFSPLKRFRLHEEIRKINNNNNNFNNNNNKLIRRI